MGFSFFSLPCNDSTKSAQIRRLKIHVADQDVQFVPEGCTLRYDEA